MAKKRKISLVLSDVDGTLVTEQKVLTSRAQSAQPTMADRWPRTKNQLVRTPSVIASNITG